mmetsp:Transcript_92786/g.251715  ORF Transcript_92786/g.251715 Transcript_92786/m.251715 type:complete len:277 (-) Transcript_92786:308-1138(-)
MLAQPEALQKVRVVVEVRPPVRHAHVEAREACLELRLVPAVPGVHLEVRVALRPWLAVPLLHVPEEPHHEPVDALLHVRHGPQFVWTRVSSCQVPAQLRSVLPDGHAPVQSSPANVVDELFCWVLVDYQGVDLIEHQHAFGVVDLVERTTSGLLRVVGRHVPRLAVDDPRIVWDARDDVGPVAVVRLVRADDGEFLESHARRHILREGVKHRPEVIEVPEDELAVTAHHVYALLGVQAHEDREGCDQHRLALAGGDLRDQGAHRVLPVFHEGLEHE